MANQERESSLSWPYQLLAVVVHLGRSNAGHFMLIVWQAEQQVWQFIDDEKTGFLEWAKVVEFAFGGPQSRIDGSAHCLVYIDARQAADLLSRSIPEPICPLWPWNDLEQHCQQYCSSGRLSRATLSTILF